MSPKSALTDEPYRARVPADVDAPDKVLYGLTFRQLAILAVAAVVFYGGWRSLHTLLPAALLIGAGVVLGGLVFGLAVGRRDGLPMDQWLLASIRHQRAPKALSTTDTTSRLPDWVDATAGRMPLPAPLRLPATAIADDGEIALPAGPAAIVAATTVNLALRTPGEQQALVDTFGRWLNSLSTPTQVVVSAQPVDLASHATGLEATAHRLPHPALEAACADHARFLDDLAHRRDPLRRQVLIVTRAHTGGRGGHAARRRADDTARSLSGLGVTTRALNGDAATAAIAACADPYRPPRTGGLAAPDTVITAPAASRQKPRKESS
ncbi:PrgI family protein [Micromonospora sp. CP22]|uniref:PrgI family protein n=1 Tax=Micromonospora sp. CP22 TaxID=2580517 RepID=UPI0012BB774A|nr:PrgI family protein [Micromonospora sp. CP22]MTK05194.1 PrgI family protein [Micromonospora sp. CP22]